MVNDEIYPEDSDDLGLVKYDVSVTPNDFNVLTICGLMDRGVITVPSFQRNYVWNTRKASKLIESLVMGLPVPQVFLFQTERNRFQVIDGQQRLLTLYFFVKERFPLDGGRAEARRLFAEGSLKDRLDDSELFRPFRLRLTDSEGGLPQSPLQGQMYGTLPMELKDALDLATIRCMAVRQNDPADDSAIYEIFSRLNTGGVNLVPQEIRGCLYDSPFYEMLYGANESKEWRRLLGRPDADARFRDVEMLLRALALYADLDSYSGSMTRFLNRFSRAAMALVEEDVQRYERLLQRFFDLCRELPDECLKVGGRLNVSLLDALFCSVARTIDFKTGLGGVVPAPDALERLRNDDRFIEKSSRSTTSVQSVRERIALAEEILLGGAAR